jgi:hypothetical protein
MVEDVGILEHVGTTDGNGGSEEQTMSVRTEHTTSLPLSRTTLSKLDSDSRGGVRRRRQVTYRSLRTPPYHDIYMTQSFI